MLTFQKVVSLGARSSISSALRAGLSMTRAMPVMEIILVSEGVWKSQATEAAVFI